MSRGTPDQGTRNKDKVDIAERCLSHMKAYRNAISFLEQRLEKSPPHLTYVTQTGDRLTVINRVHARMRMDHQLLQAGLQARWRACDVALRS